MKKTITLLFAGLLTLGISAQNFGLGVDYMMLSGTMVEESDHHDHDHDHGDEDELSTSSAVLNLSYSYSINDDMSVIGSVGYGMGFGLIPMKAKFNYGITDKIHANVGIGMYMITDESYDPKEVTIGEDEWKGSTNEFGMSMGVSYAVMNNIGVSLGYEMIK
jgi:opacity protein-like surface antigen